MKRLLFALPLVVGLTAGLVGCGDTTTDPAPVAATGLMEVDSSAFSHVGFDAGAQELTVVFRDTGSTYVYSGISAELGQAFLSADSLGGFYHSNIRDQFESAQQ